VGDAMITLKLMIIATMLGSGMLIMHTEKADAPIVLTDNHTEIVRQEIMPAASIELPVDIGHMYAPIIYPGDRIETINEETVPAVFIEKKGGLVSINQDKTYEQCKREAFERVYEEVNKMLDQIPDRCEERLQLQMMTQ
jgi:hypothetical protein